MSKELQNYSKSKFSSPDVSLAFWKHFQHENHRNRKFWKENIFSWVESNFQLCIAAHETPGFTVPATMPCFNLAIILAQKTIGRLFKQAPVTHIKEGLAPCTPDTTAEREKSRCLGSLTPGAAESWENGISKRITGASKLLLQRSGLK